MKTQRRAPWGQIIVRENDGRFLFFLLDKKQRLLQRMPQLPRRSMRVLLNNLQENHTDNGGNKKAANTEDQLLGLDLKLDYENLIDDDQIIGNFIDADNIFDEGSFDWGDKTASNDKNVFQNAKENNNSQDNINKQPNDTNTIISGDKSANDQCIGQFCNVSEAENENFLFYLGNDENENKINFFESD